MINTTKVLIIDDDKHIAELISLYLNKENFMTKCIYTGANAVEEFDAYNPDLVLLDIMLPEKDGYDICKEIRAKSKTPIIMLTAKGEVFNKILGLELGADDYIPKPFDGNELVARVKAVLRRTIKTEEQNSDKKTTVSYPGLEINIANYTVIYKNETLDMPPKELELLWLFASNPNIVFTREQLLNKVWGYDFTGNTRTVDVHIKRIRDKFDELNDAFMIKTIHRIGYKFEVK